MALIMESARNLRMEVAEAMKTSSFQSLEECKNQCENICSLPLVTGPCRAAIRSYILKTVVILHIGTHVAADKHPSQPTIGFLSTALRRMNIDDTVLSYICVDNQYYCVRIPHHYSEESMEQSTDFTNLPTSSNTCLEGHDDEEMVMEPPFTTTLKMLNQRANSSDIESSSNKTKREKNKDAVKKHRRKLNEYLEIAPKNIRNMEQIVKELDKSIRETENHIRTLQEMLHKHSTI